MPIRRSAWIDVVDSLLVDALNRNRPITPDKHASVSYCRNRDLLLARCRDVILAEGWECKDVARRMPSLRAKAFKQIVEHEEYFWHGLRFAHSFAEACGVPTDLPAWTPPLVTAKRVASRAA